MVAESLQCGDSFYACHAINWEAFGKWGAGADARCEIKWKQPMGFLAKGLASLLKKGVKLLRDGSKGNCNLCSFRGRRLVMHQDWG